MTFRLREDQSLALRRAQVARDLCAFLEKDGNLTRHDATRRLVQSTDQAGRTSWFHLSERGPLDRLATPMGRVAQLQIDDLGQLHEIVEPSGQRTQIDYDAQGLPSSFARDGQRLAQFRWSDDRSTNFCEFWDGTTALGTYANGRPVALTNRLGQTQHFSYDDAELLTRWVDPRGEVTSFAYDDLGRPSVTTYPDGRVESASYDGAGHCAAFALHGAPLLERVGDTENRPLSVKYVDGAEYSYEYDDHGRMLAATGPHGSLNYAYGEDGRLLSETHDGQTFKFEYDPTGLLSGMEYPDGTRAAFGYDADKRLNAVSWGEISVALTHDLVDKRRSISTPQFQTEVELHPSGKPSRVTVTQRRSQVVQFDTHYAYDVQGRLASRKDQQHGEERFHYDAESQLLGVSNAAGQWRETFAYDAAGNRQHTSGQNVSVLSGNRLHSQGDYECIYDERGNLIELRTGGGSTHFGYDLKNQMVRASGPRGVVEFKYDALGRRIEKKSAERTIRYVWVGELLAREIVGTADGEVTRDYLYRPGSFEPIALRVDGRYYYYHNDHLGTPQRLTDGDGRVVWSARYFAYGFAEVEVGIVENPLRFEGQYADVETGLHYNRYRYYSPVLGRYLSVDPIGLGGGPNLYLYAGNNPLNKTDPLGLFWKELGVGLMAAGAAALVIAAAPAAVPFLAIAAIAAPIGFAIGMGIGEYQSIGSFCKECFWKGVGDTALPAFLGAAGIGLLLATVAAPAAAIVGVGLAAVAIYGMCDHHFGWSSGKPFDQMNDREKSESLGRLVGGTGGGLLGGLTGGLLGKGLAAEPAGKGGPGKGGSEESTGEPNPKNGEGKQEGPAEEPKEQPGPVAKRDLDAEYGAPKDPGGRTGIKDFERNPDGSVIENPTIQRPSPGNPPRLEPGKDYIWLVDKDGNLIVAEEVPTGKTLPDGRPERLGHPTLVDGQPARIGGEIKQGPEGPTINNRSGRYSGHPDRGAEQLDNAAKLFEESGMPVKTDFSAPR